jgi:hypothetical protein
MFVVARITSLNVVTGTGENIFGVSDGLQNFFNTGLLGAVITTIVASLAWRIVASSFPLAFMSNPLIYLIIRLCLFLEMTGVCSAAWLLALIHKQVAGYQSDEVYLGDAQEGDNTSRDIAGDEEMGSKALMTSKDESAILADVGVPVPGEKSGTVDATV